MDRHVADGHLADHRRLAATNEHAVTLLEARLWLSSIHSGDCLLLANQAVTYCPHESMAPVSAVASRKRRLTRVGDQMRTQVSSTFGMQEQRLRACPVDEWHLELITACGTLCRGRLASERILGQLVDDAHEAALTGGVAASQQSAQMSP